MNYRYERKYLVPNFMMDKLRNRLMSFVRPDIHAGENGGKVEYTVRSIYFDTPNLDAYQEKDQGLKDRKKLRIRGYNEYREGNQVFLEIKRKFGNRIAKNRALTNYDKLEKLIESGDWNPSKDMPEKMFEDGSRFFYNLKRYCQTPVNLVVYDREPYHGIFDPGVRITFDKNIRARMYPDLSELYSEKGLHYVWKDAFILEIKYFDKGMPSWARSMVKEFELSRQALSKYASAIDTQALRSF